MNLFGGGSRETIRTTTPPPAYGEIVKTEDDWKEALRRMGGLVFRVRPRSIVCDVTFIMRSYSLTIFDLPGKIPTDA